MGIGYVIQIVLFILLATSVLVIVFGAALAIPRSHKIKSYRYSRRGDAWVLGRGGKDKA